MFTLTDVSGARAGVPLGQPYDLYVVVWIGDLQYALSRNGTLVFGLSVAVRMNISVSI